jgi:DNA-binding CsgD family transcriptional regulator
MHAKRDELIATLYASAMGNLEWHVSLADLAAYSNTRCITLDYYDLDEHAGGVIASNMAPHPAIEEYNQVHGRRNILIERAYPGIEPGLAFTASSLVAIRDFERTELFNTVYRALGIKHAAAVPLDIEHVKIVQLSLIKPIDGGDFSPADLRLLGDLSPHLLQAWAGYRHLQRLNDTLETISTLWDSFEHAVIVVDKRQRIHFANRAGEALLRDGGWLSSHAGFLRACDPNQAVMLNQALQQVLTAQREVQCLTPGAIDKPAMIATLFRINRDRVALIISDPLRSAQDFREGLMRIFHLTSTEAGLVNELLQGSSLREYAANNDIGYETARTHLKNAMHKNGWHRQGEMIAIVLKRLLPLGLFERERD